MTDRELLELAAKAAAFGTNGTCWTESEYPRGSGKHGALWNYVGHMDTAELWNPLTDDGDAFRLAVKLRMSVTNTDIRTSVLAQPEPNTDWVAPTEPHNGDPCAATRRAVVRAAAAIGEQQ